MLVSGLAYSLTLKMETCSYGTFDYEMAEHYIPEDGALHDHYCGKLKSCTIYLS
jgi:hypothetical protein